MEADQAVLSSITSQVEELSNRLVGLAERYRGGPREDIAAELYEAERALRRAHRRLAGLTRTWT